MKIAHYDETTQKLLGWYDKDIHTTIPTPNIEITNEVWQSAIDVGANYVDVTAKTFSVKDFRTDAETETQRVLSITAKATETIEAKYSPLKQRKMMSVSIGLLDKVNTGGTLTADEEAAMQDNRDTNMWITSIRTIENVAIADGTLLVDVVW